MKKLIILTDEASEFQISKADSKNFSSMEIDKIKAYFILKDYEVNVIKFSELNLNRDYAGTYVLYQSSEAPGLFYKRYIENLVYTLEKSGAVVLPRYEYLKAHHDKVFMEMLRSGFADASLKTIKSICYGSWTDARNYDSEFPAVIKKSSSSASAGVFLAKNRREYEKYIKKAGRTIIAGGLWDLFVNYLKKTGKKIIKLLYPSKARFVEYNTDPVSTPLVVQKFIKGLKGDYKVLIFGGKYYLMYRKNRDNDFRASGSGKFFDVPEQEHEGLLDFAHKITAEIKFPVIGMDIGFDGKDYHLIEFQMIHLGTSALQRSRFWHEYQDGKWIRFEGKSILEEEFSRAIDEYINTN